MEKLFFDNGQGTKLCGIISDIDPKKPIVIQCHGFSSSKESKTYYYMEKLLTEKGISSFRFDFYGHGESEGAFKDITVSEGVRDLDAAIDFLTCSGFTRIAVLGSSYGGMVVLQVAAKHPELKAVVARAPVSDYFGKIIAEKSETEISQWKKDGYIFYKSGSGKKLLLNRSFLDDSEKWSVTKVAKDITMPVLIIHGDVDTSVPISQSETSATLIPNCQLHIIKGTGHDFTGHEEETYKLAVDFFVENFKK